MLAFGLSLVKDNSAATAIEYGLILGLASLAVAAATVSLGGSISFTFSVVMDRIIASTP